MAVGAAGAGSSAARLSDLTVGAPAEEVRRNPIDQCWYGCFFEIADFARTVLGIGTAPPGFSPTRVKWHRLSAAPLPTSWEYPDRSGGAHRSSH